MHIRLAKGKWIDISGRIEVSQAVVDESMGRLVRPDSVENVKEFGIRIQTPVINRDFWSGLVGPNGQMTMSGVLQLDA